MPSLQLIVMAIDRMGDGMRDAFPLHIFRNLINVRRKALKRGMLLR